MRVVTPAEAVAGIRSGQAVYLHCAAATPSVLLDSLVARAPELQDVSVVHLHVEGPGPHLAPKMAGHSATGRCSSVPTPARLSTRAAPTTSLRRR